MIIPSRSATPSYYTPWRDSMSSTPNSTRHIITFTSRRRMVPCLYGKLSSYRCLTDLIACRRRKYPYDNRTRLIKFKIGRNNKESLCAVLQDIGNPVYTQITEKRQKK